MNTNTYNPLFGVRTRPTPLPTPPPRNDVLYNTQPSNVGTLPKSGSAPQLIPKKNENSIGIKYIIENTPPTKIVREFYRENIQDLESSDSF